jgi:hypothetical protein
MLLEQSMAEMLRAFECDVVHAKGQRSEVSIIHQVRVSLLTSDF